MNSGMQLAGKNNLHTTLDATVQDGGLTVTYLAWYYIVGLERCPSWPKEQHWKCCSGVTRSWVRIPAAPPPDLTFEGPL